MPQIVIKQPTGLLANFSTIVDDFTVSDATPEQLTAYKLREAGEMNRVEIEQSIERGLADTESWICPEGRPAREDGLGRWLSALKTIAAIHGEKEAQLAVELTTQGASYPEADAQAAIQQGLADRAKQD